MLHNFDCIFEFCIRVFFNNQSRVAASLALQPATANTRSATLLSTQGPKHLIHVLSFLYAGLFVCLCVSKLSAQESDYDLRNPANRFTQENTSVDNLSYWPAPIRLGVVGTTDVELRQRAISSAIFFGHASGAKFDFQKSPAFSESDGESAKTANYLVLFANELASGERSLGGSQIRELLTLNEAAALTADLEKHFLNGLPKVGNGCFGKWKANQNNHIEGLMIVVDSALPQSAQIACFENLIIRSFGIRPVVNRYTVKLDGGASGTFFNNSEIVLALEAQKFCRAELFDARKGCVELIVESTNRGF